VEPTVAVTVPGAFPTGKTSVWRGQQFTLTFSTVSRGATKIVSR
jgi:hypothetical protein